MLFNDSDILASPDLLSRHLDAIATQPHCGRRLGGAGRETSTTTRASATIPGTPALHPPSRKRLSWLYFLTGNASVRRDDLVRVGGFDESFTGYGHEDFELGYRLQKAGIEILYEPRAVNYHCQDVDTAIKRTRCGWPAVRRCVSTASIRILR